MSHQLMGGMQDAAPRSLTLMKPCPGHYLPLVPGQGCPVLPGQCPMAPKRPRGKNTVSPQSRSPCSPPSCLLGT